MRLLWEDRAWSDYLYWQTQDKKTLKRINGLIKDIQRSTFEGIGKPEPLKENLSGMWSRRIDDTNRIVYYEKDEIIYIVSCTPLSYAFKYLPVSFYNIKVHWVICQYDFSIIIMTFT